MTKMQWSTDPELNAALELDAKKLADMGVEGHGDEEPTCTKCGCFFTVDVGDEVTPYCNDCAHTLVEDFENREQLVQNVIAKYKALVEAMLNGTSDCESEDAALFDALSKLAGWTS